MIIIILIINENSIRKICVHMERMKLITEAHVWLIDKWKDEGGFDLISEYKMDMNMLFWS